jgi:hypothetical protein
LRFTFLKRKKCCKRTVAIIKTELKKKNI